MNVAGTNKHTRRTFVPTKLLGPLEATVSLGGLGGLFTELCLLAASPLPGVALMLGSMALLAGSMGRLGQAQELRQESIATCERNRGAKDSDS